LSPRDAVYGAHTSRYRDFLIQSVCFNIWNYVMAEQNFMGGISDSQFESEGHWNAVARDVKCGMETETQLHVLYEIHFVCQKSQIKVQSLSFAVWQV
jgi:hypothetical protein